MEKKLEERIMEAFPDSVREIKFMAGKRVVSVVVNADMLREVADFLKREVGFDVLVSVGAIDYIDAKVFQLVYYVWSSSRGVLMMMKADLPRDNPSAFSLVNVWEAADYHERETWEMFGINFQEHPNLTRLLLPEEWEGGFPLRRDFVFKPGGEA
ncbi:MAG: NADH-quinone oxidoreductase subunit C [Candidatus Bathyarchaeia archaeon]